jgi:SAM-dependent methyltransferase
MALTWTEIAARPVIRLNLGGGRDSHPDPRYMDYISVDAEGRTPFSVQHDLSRPMPLADGAVDRILSEHALEHVDRPTFALVLAECHRLLRPGGVARIGVPDYHHPRQRHCLKLGHDPRRRNHLTLTTVELCRELVSASPFRTGDFRQYWDGDRFVHGSVDYSLGYLRRTPEHDPRNQCHGIGQWLGRLGRDLGEILRHGPFVRRIHFITRKYHPLAETSIVFDLHKPA